MIFLAGCVNAFFSPYVSVSLSRIGLLFGLEKAGMGWTLSASSAGTIGAALIGGALCDRLGHRHVLLSGLLLSVVGYGLCAMSPHFAFLLMGLLILGSAFGLAWPAALSLLSSLHPDNRRRMFSLLLVSGSLFGSVSPGLYSLLVPHLKGRWILFPFAVFACSYVVLILVLSRECFPVPALQQRFQWKNAGRLLRTPVLLVACAMILLHVGSDTGLYGWMPTYLEETFPDPRPFRPGLALSFYSMAYASSRGLMALLPERLPNLPIILLSSLLGGSLSLVSVRSLGYASSVASYVAAAFCFSWEYVALLALVGDRFPQNSGAAFGILNAMGPLGATIFPALMGWMAQGRRGLRGAVSLPGIGFLVLALLAAGCLVTNRKSRSSRVF